MAMNPKFERKYGKVVYDATIDTSSPRCIEIKNIREKRVKFTIIYVVILFLICFVPLWIVCVFSTPIFLPSALLTILLTFYFLGAVGYAIYAGIHYDPRLRVFLTEKGIFCGVEPYNRLTTFFFIRYNDITGCSFETNPMGIPVLDIIMTPKGRIKNFGRKYIPIEDIRDPDEFVKKLNEMLITKDNFS